VALANNGFGLVTVDVYAGIELSKHCALPHSVVERARTIACHFEDLEKVSTELNVLSSNGQLIGAVHSV
jgi:hypothetical protein